MELKVKVHEVGKTIQVTEKFKKRDVVLIDESNPQYPQPLLFQLTQSKCDIGDLLKEGEIINVHFNLKGRQFIAKDGAVKYFNTLEIWKFDFVQAQQAKPIDYSEMPIDDDLAF